MYASPSQQTPDATPRIGEWFSESFSLFGREWVTWVLQGLVYMVLASIPIIPGMVMYYGAIFRMMATSQPGSPPPDPSTMIGAIIPLYGGGCLSAFIGLYLLIGMSRTAMKQVRGEPISVGDIFSGADVYLPVLGAYILAVLAIYAGLFVCVLPGLLLTGLWIFVHPLIVERKMGVFDAFRTSFNVTRPHMWSYLGWALLIMLVYMVGGSTGCGALVSLPLAIIMMMVSYRDAFERPAGFTPAPQVQATPPVYYGPAGPPAAGGSCPACGRMVAAGAVVCTACGTPLPGGPGEPPAPTA
ncbi:MAG: hypothetical protein ACO1SX_01580 [Actinomycetota bacterium]